LITENSGRLNTGDDESIAHTLRRVETADVRRGCVGTHHCTVRRKGLVRDFRRD